MATYDPRGDGRSGCVRWLDLAGRSRRHKCNDRRAANKIIAEIERLKALCIDWQPARDRQGPAALDAVIAAYLEQRAIRVSPQTLRVDGNHLEIAGRFFAARKVTLLRQLSAPLLDDLLAWLLRPDTGLHGHQRAPQSANRTAGAVLLLWQWAEDCGRYPDAPRAPRKMQLARTVRKQVVAPTWAEMDACIAAARGHYVRLATWLRYTGLRIGESTQVEWTDIDMAAGMLTIRPEIDKNGIGRTVPLHPALLDAIATWGKREGKVIPPWRRLQNIATGMGLIWKRAEVREAAWKRHPDHAFRRGFKSGLLALGANPDAVDFLQGHTLGKGQSSRGAYIDGAHLPLLATLMQVPPIRVPGLAPSRVVNLPHRR